MGLILCAGPAGAATMASTGLGFGVTADGRDSAIGCMTSAILHEAGFEPRAGQEAVAEVILNRLHHPAFPKTVCGVIFQGAERRTGCQFSFACDGSLHKILPAAAISRARDVAIAAVDGLLVSRIAGATHYHADYVSPYWAPTLVRIGAIGRHIFYRQPGASAFSAMGRYLGIGDQMPASLAAGLRDATSAITAAAPSLTPVQRECFSLWGLAPVAQAGAGSRQ